MRYRSDNDAMRASPTTLRTEPTAPNVLWDAQRAVLCALMEKKNEPEWARTVLEALGLSDRDLQSATSGDDRRVSLLWDGASGTVGRVEPRAGKRLPYGRDR